MASGLLLSAAWGTGHTIGQLSAALQTALSHLALARSHILSGAGRLCRSGEGCVTGTAPLDRWMEPLSNLPLAFWRQKGTPKSTLWNTFSESMRLARWGP